MRNMDAAIELLVSWANVNSGSGNLFGLERMRILLSDAFSKVLDAKIQTIVLPGTDALALHIDVRPHAKRQVLLSGHYDTVYGPDHPFQSCTFLDGNVLQGPGVADMKGGLVVMLEAIQDFENSPVANHLGYEIVITPDEETGSFHSRSLLESIAQSKRHDFGLVFEPARPNGDLVKSRKGVGRFTVTVHGRAAHAGRDPESGRNAILALAEILQPIHDIQLGMSGLLINVGTIRGGGVLNVVPDVASADLNVRITSLGDSQIFHQRVQEILDSLPAARGCSAEMTGCFDRPPKSCTSFEESLFASWQQCGRELGVDFSWQHVGGGSDGNLLSFAGMDNLDGLGPIGDHLHSDRECCLISSLSERAAVASLFLQRVADGTVDVSTSPSSRK